MSDVRDEMMKRILSGKIVQAPTACYKAEPNGMVSDELIEFYTPRAENLVLDMTSLSIVLLRRADKHRHARFRWQLPMWSKGFLVLRVLSRTMVRSRSFSSLMQAAQHIVRLPVWFLGRRAAWSSVKQRLDWVTPFLAQR